MDVPSRVRVALSEMLDMIMILVLVFAATVKITAVSTGCLLAPLEI